MPYLGLRNSEPVMPIDVSEDETVICPLCDGKMGVKASHYNRGKLIARHFYHHSSADCGGESDIHLKMKSIAAVKLREIFENATVQAEKPIGDRFADVCATFDTPRDPLGKGLIVEPQHKHKDKNIGQVTHEYLSRGWSVFWAYQSDFDDHDMEFAEHRMRNVWPNAVPITEGVDGYPEPVQNFVFGERPSVEIEIPFPREYWRIHERELGSPAQTKIYETNWTDLDDAWLHSKGSEIAWFTLFRDPDGTYWLEFWQKDRNTDESRFVPVCVGPDAAATIETFRQTAGERLNDGNSYQSDSGLVSIVNAEFAGTRATIGWLSLAATPNGRMELILGRNDARGNTRTVTVDYRDGDIDRLSDLRSLLKQTQ